MNFKHLFLIACSAFVIYSCGGKIDRPAPVLTADQIAQSQSRVETPTIPSGGVVSSVMHYTCPNGHAGSDTQGTCISCGATLEHNQAYHNQPAAGADPAAAPTTPEPPQNSAGVWHYTCPNGHEGGSGSATACSVCGTTLVHNTVYHSTGDVTTPGAEGITALPSDAPATPATPEPAQNAAGVWHYTCPNGHAGGSGSATACTECGTTLVHNTAYH